MKIPDNLRAVVTGGGSGLGRAFALELAAAQAKVVVADIDLQAAMETAQRVVAAGGSAQAIQVDVAKWDSFSELRDQAVAWLGEIDLVINNAGVGVRGGIETTSLEDWHWVMGINLYGVIHGCRAFLPAMKERNAGYVINIASLAGLIPGPKLGPYNVSKAAVVSLSETLYSELMRSGVNVSVVCPSYFRTNIMNSGRGEQSKKAQAFVERAMHRSKVQAPQVARSALQAVFKNELYVLPMADARFYWRFKRFLPSFFHRMIAAPKKNQQTA